MERPIRCLAFAIAWSTLGGGSLLGLSTGDDLPIEKTAPTYELKNNPHPSLPELIQGLEDRTIKEPENAEVWYQLGLAYNTADRYSDAVTALQKALYYDSTHVRARENLAINLYFAHRFDESLEAFARADNLGASDPTFLNDYGLVLMQIGRLQESEAAIVKGLKASPNSRMLWNSQGLLLGHQKKFAEAIKAFQQAVQIDPSYAIGWTNLSEAQAKSGAPDDAIASGRKAVALNPKMGPAWVNLAVVYAQKGLSQEAYDAAQNAFALAPNDAGPGIVMGHCGFLLGNWTEAALGFHRALDVLEAHKTYLQNDQQFIEALSEYAQVTLHLGHLDDAERIINTALALDPNNAMALDALGVLRVHQKRWDEALAASLKSTGFAPQIPRLWNTLGTIYLLGFNKPDEALKAFQKGIALWPTDVDAWYGSGQAQEKLNQSADAVASYQKAVTLNPKLDEAWARLSALSPDAAAAAKTQIAKVTASNEAVLITEGDLQVQLKNLPEAEKKYLKATELEPDDPLSWAHLGQAYLLDKKNPEALAALEKSLPQLSRLLPKDQALIHGYLAQYHLTQETKGPEELQAALDTSNQAVSEDPTNAKLWYLAAVCQHKLGHTQEEAVDMAKCQQLGGVPELAPPATTSASPAPPASTNTVVAPTSPPGKGSATLETLPDEQKDALAIKALLKDHKIDEAVAAAQRATELRPDRALGWYSLGDALMCVPRTDEAIAALNKANSLDPKMGPTWFDLGVCLANKGQFGEAENALAKSIDIMPDFPLSWQTLTQCYASQKDLKGSEDRVQALTQAHPNCAYGWWALGACQIMTKDLPTAIATLQKSIDLNPQFYSSWNSMGMAEGMANHPDKAIECFTKALQLNPTDVESLNNIGYTWFLKGQTDVAIDYYKKGLQINPKHTRALFNLITAYAKKEQWDLARSTCNTLAQIEPATAAQLRQNFPHLAETSPAISPNSLLSPTP